MTLDPVIDAEVIEPLDQPSAQRLDKRIRLLVGTINDNIDKLAKLVDEAEHGNVHVTLGFASWTAYVADVFRSAPLRLKGDARKKVVSYLSGKGMSQRGIAETVGADQATVSRDLAAQSGDAVASPERTTGLDGKEYRRFPRKAAEAAEEDDPPPLSSLTPGGRGNDKKQLHGLERIRPSLLGISTALEFLFDGRFEKTCTPDVAKDYAGLLKAELQRINRIVKLLEAYGDDQIADDAESA